MKLMSDSGLWSTGWLNAPTPALAVLEVSGAVLSWTVDDPSAAAQITFTDPAHADWLWRVIGESGHSALASAIVGRDPSETQTVDLAGVDVLPGSLDALRGLAVGHWLRRWWPASHRDGIVALDAALLDAEIALLTAAAQDYFTDDTIDSNVSELLRPHAVTLNAHLQQGDPRVIELVERCAEIAEDVGVPMDATAAAARRDDFALAAGGSATPTGPATVTSGVSSIHWSAVPPGVFDAAENTVDWTVEASAQAVRILVRTELAGLGSPHGIAARFRSGAFVADGALGADGRAVLVLVGGQQQPVTESAAWNHDWRAAAVSIGADVEESEQVRERVRRFARSRLEGPTDDAFLAEIVAAESDY